MTKVAILTILVILGHSGTRLEHGTPRSCDEQEWSQKRPKVTKVHNSSKSDKVRNSSKVTIPAKVTIPGLPSLTGVLLPALTGVLLPALTGVTLPGPL